MNTILLVVGSLCWKPAFALLPSVATLMFCTAAFRSWSWVWLQWLVLLCMLPLLLACLWIGTTAIGAISDVISIYDREFIPAILGTLIQLFICFTFCLWGVYKEDARFAQYAH